MTEDPGRISGHDRVGWNVFRDDTAGAHDGILADADVGQDRGARPMDAPFLTTVRSTFQSASVCRFPSGRGGARIGVIDKRHSMPDEDIVFDDDAFADKGVTGDLAALTHRRIFLDFHERTDLGLVPDLAPVQIDELRKPDILPQLTSSAMQFRNSQVDQSSSLSQRFTGRFQHLDDSQPCAAVVEGLLPVRNAIDKVGQFLTQRLDLFQLRGPHISGAIIHQQFVEAFAVRNVHSLVVNLYFSSASRSFQTNIRFSPPISVVLTFTGESQLTLICAMTLLWKVECHEGHIFKAIQMCLTGCDDRLRAPFDQVIHDREVVRRKVPKNIDIVLEKAKVDPSGIVIVELPQRSFIQQLPDFLHGAREEEGVVHHDFEILLTREIDQFFSLCGIAGERLLDENVFAILQRAFRQRKVGPTGVTTATASI